MKVTLITKSLFRRFEYTLAAFALKLINLTQTNLSGRTDVDKALEKVKAALKTLNEVLVRVRKHAYTDEIAKIDTKRENYYRAFVGRLESDIFWDFDNQIMENATKLLTIVEENGKAIKRSALEKV